MNLDWELKEFKLKINHKTNSDPSYLNKTLKLPDKKDNQFSKIFSEKELSNVSIRFFYHFNFKNINFFFKILNKGK